MITFNEVENMFNPFNIISDFFKSQARYYRIMSELSSLTDRELSDIGLNRYEISHVAMSSACKNFKS